MSCACKNSKNIEKMLYKNDAKYEKKGLFNLIMSFSTSFLNKLIIILLLLILIPIVILVILCNFIFRDKLAFTIPKFITNYMKNKKNE